MPRPVLPIKIDATSNGEFAPVPVDAAIDRARGEAARRIAENARRTGQDRRAFLAGLCGAATALLTFNQAFAFRGSTGGRFELAQEAALEPAAAEASLAGEEFIFDVQTHMVNPSGLWRDLPSDNWEAMLTGFPYTDCGEADPIACFDSDHYIKEVFLDSDTQLAVLSFVPEVPEGNPLDLAEAARVKRIVEALEGDHRLLLHAMVVPNRDPMEEPLERMARVAEEWPIAAWKVYTQWAPGGAGFGNKAEGWWLDSEDVGIPFIEQARALGIRRICIHKGLPFPGFPLRYAGCEDVGRAARMFPDVEFLIYHSGFVAGRDEGPYTPETADLGIDSLIKSLHDNDIAPNSNVYAELGSTWRHVMRDPTMAAHTIGKLVKHVGEDRVLWGTDSIWYGSPQDQIQAFRTFQISEELMEEHGYPRLTPQIKAKIFGLNGAEAYGLDPAELRRKAAVDRMGTTRQAYRAAPRPSHDTYGPRNAKEWRAFKATHGHRPG